MGKKSRKGANTGAALLEEVSAKTQEFFDAVVPQDEDTGEPDFSRLSAATIDGSVRSLVKHGKTYISKVQDGIKLSSGGDFQRHFKIKKEKTPRLGKWVNYYNLFKHLASYHKENAPISLSPQRLALKLTRRQCANCGRFGSLDEEALRVCDYCGSVRYCSERCQDVHWHREHCYVCYASKIRSSRKLDETEKDEVRRRYLVYLNQHYPGKKISGDEFERLRSLLKPFLCD